MWTANHAFSKCHRLSWRMAVDFRATCCHIRQTGHISPPAQHRLSPATSQAKNPPITAAKTEQELENARRWKQMDYQTLTVQFCVTRFRGSQIVHDDTSMADIRQRLNKITIPSLISLQILLLHLQNDGMKRKPSHYLFDGVCSKSKFTKLGTFINTAVLVD